MKHKPFPYKDPEKEREYQEFRNQYEKSKIMTIAEKEQQIKEQQFTEAEKLLNKMNTEQAIFFCEQLAERLPNINHTPPIHRESEDKYLQFWQFGVVSAIKAIEQKNRI
jgi:hypothetical protein